MAICEWRFTSGCYIRLHRKIKSGRPGGKIPCSTAGFRKSMSTGRHLRNKPTNRISPTTTLPCGKTSDDSCCTSGNSCQGLELVTVWEKRPGIALVPDRRYVWHDIGFGFGTRLVIELRPRQMPWKQNLHPQTEHVKQSEE